MIVRDAIEWFIGALGDLAASSLQAAEDLQAIQFRLQGFNFQAALDSGIEYNAAMEESIRLTEEQMSWVMRLAAQSPYDATDIGFVFSMATAYGYTSDEAKTLTESTMDFVAAMGLSSVEQRRVIINLGQMVQRGKITTREMNDLARGSLLPLADVLDRVAEKMGITSEALSKMISAPGAGVDYQLFIDSFNEMVAGEERFIDAGKRMAVLFKASLENVYQSTRDVIGYYILIPGILGPVGKAVAGIMETITEEGNWNKIITAATRVGEALGSIVTELINLLMPSGESVVNGITSGLDGLATWLEDNKEKIVGFFVGIATTIKEDIIPWIRDRLIPALVKIYNWVVENGPKIYDFFSGIYTIIKDKIVVWVEEKLVPAFNEIKKWVKENGPKISEFFSALGEIIGKVVENLVGKGGKGEGTGISAFLDKLLIVMQWVIDHTDQIALWINNWIILIVVWQTLKIVLDGIFVLLTTGIPIAFSIIVIWIGKIEEKLVELVGNTITKFFELPGEIMSQPWYQTGVDIITNIINGIGSLLGTLTSTVVNMLVSAWNEAMAALGLPSIPDMGGGGGGNKIVKKITKGGGSPSPSSSLSSSAVMPFTSQVASTNNYNLTIVTNASREPIIQDFAALKQIAA
jgi:tape measure domain-containing protein